jgi:hypothetical protein
MSPREIAIGATMPRNNVDQLLFEMSKSGDVLKTGRGKYAHPSRTDLLDTANKNDKKIRTEQMADEEGDYDA